MNHLLRFTGALITLVLLTGAAPSDSGRQTLLIRSSDVVLHLEADSTLGQYYTISYALPEGLAGDDLDLVLLEMFVDVTAKAREDQINQSPVLELYALKQPHGNNFDPENLNLEGRAVRPVKIGSGRRVVLDVTGIVRANLDGRTANHGLIMGSLTGMREGEFILTSDRLPEGAVGRIVIYQRLEFVPADVMSESHGSEHH